MEKNDELKALLAEGIACLEQHGVEEARQDAWLLLEEVCGISRSYYFAHSEETVSQEKARAYRKMLEKRAKRIPLQQITGKAWFYGLEFQVNEHVLIPRQDTEILVEEALKRIQGPVRLLDLCTGSGCILLAILANSGQVEGTGADISAEALETAEKNAENLKLPASFIQSDLFENIEEKFGMIVSNPPYIRSDVIPTLAPEVKEHEPYLALDGKEDGLYFYRKIVRESSSHLLPGGWLCFEIGFDQGEDVRLLLAVEGFEKIEVIKDLAGLDRVVLGQKP